MSRDALLTMRVHRVPFEALNDDLLDIHLGFNARSPDGDIRARKKMKDGKYWMVLISVSS